MNEEKTPQRNSKPQPQAQPETTPTTEPNASVPSKDAGWAGASPTQVMRTVAVALLTAAVVLGAFFLLWQVRTFIGWFVIALFLAAVLSHSSKRATCLQAHGTRGERARGCY